MRPGARAPAGSTRAACERAERGGGPGVPVCSPLRWWPERRRQMFARLTDLVSDQLSKWETLAVWIDAAGLLPHSPSARTGSRYIPRPLDGSPAKIRLAALPGGVRVCSIIPWLQRSCRQTIRP